MLATVVALGVAEVRKNYGPGVTDSEIKLGQPMPYSGPVSVFGTVGRAETAYFDKLNAASMTGFIWAGPILSAGSQSVPAGIRTTAPCPCHGATCESLS